jgi:hypothetical protein
MEKRIRKKKKYNPMSVRRIKRKLTTFWNKHWDVVIAMVIGFVISQFLLFWFLK